MKRKTLLKFILYMLFIIPIFNASSQEEAPLESPFFIDGFLCEGTSLKNLEKSLGYNSLDEGRKKEIQIRHNRNLCEKLFSTYDVKKYSWISMDEIRGLKDEMRLNQHFKTADISLQKSEIKNHIYLKLDIEMRTDEELNFYMELFNVGNASELNLKAERIWYNGNFGKQKISLERFNYLDGVIANDNEIKHKLNPLNIFSWNSAYELGRWSSDVELNIMMSKNLIFTEKEKEMYLIDSELKGNIEYSQTSDLAEFRYGFLYHMFSPKSYNESISLKESKGIINPGLSASFFSGNSATSYFFVKLFGYKEINSKLSYNLNTKIEYGRNIDSQKFVFDQFKVYFESQDFHNYNSSEGRTLMGNKKISHFGIETSKDIQFLGKNDKIKIALESKSIGSESKDGKEYLSQRLGGGGVSFSSNYKDWNVDIGFKYLN